MVATQPSVRDENLGVVVDGPSGLFLLATVRRKGRNVYYFPPHDAAASQLDDGTPWNPHVSYHGSGQHHFKTYNERVLPVVQRPPPTEAFVGTQPVFDHSFPSVGLSGSHSVALPTTFDELLRIPESIFRPHGFFTLSVYLVEPGRQPADVPYRSTFLMEHYFRAQAPYIYVSLWRKQL